MIKGTLRNNIVSILQGSRVCCVCCTPPCQDRDEGRVHLARLSDCGLGEGTTALPWYLREQTTWTYYIYINEIDLTVKNPIILCNIFQFIIGEVSHNVPSFLEL